MKKYTKEELLDYLAAHAKIDLDSVREEMQQNEKEKIIAQYLPKIKQLCGKDQRWYVRVPDPSKPDGRKKIVARSKEDLVEKVYQWHIGQHAQPVEEEECTLTIKELWPMFVEHKLATTWSIPTRMRNQSIWDNIICKTDLVSRPIKAVTFHDLEKWAYGVIKEHGLTRKAWNNISGIMSGIFDFAERRGSIDINPSRALKIANRAVFRTPEGKPSEELVLTPEQEITLYKACMDQYESGVFRVNTLIPLAVICMFQTGVRPCEVCAIRNEDIRDGQLHITRYFSEKANAVLEDHTKAGHGPRRVDLTALAQGIINEAIRYKKAHGIKSKYVFLTGPSMYSFYSRLRKAVPDLCKILGIPRNTPYAGRRTFISSCLDSGINLDTIRNYVGHVDVKTTLDHYNHDRSTREQKLEQLEKARPSVPIVPNSKNMKKTP